MHLESQGRSVGIVMGSYSDYEVMKEAEVVLKKFDIDYEINILSAHRTPGDLFEYGNRAVDRNVKVIIAAAGGAAHLPGMMAAITAVPVIGVPVKSKALNGMDSLLSIVQMPKGVPVATVAIDGAVNAALLAIQILGVNNKEVLNKVIEYKRNLESEVEISRKML